MALENFAGVFGKPEPGLVVDVKGGVGSGLAELLDLVVKLGDRCDPARETDVNQVPNRGQVGLVLRHG